MEIKIIIDTHAHIYPDKIASRAAKSIGEFYGLEMNSTGTVQNLIDENSKAGIDKTLVCSVAITADRVEKINDFLAEETAMHEKFIGFGTIHPDFENVETEIKRVKNMGLVGLKIHPDFQHFLLDSNKAIKMFEIATDYQMPFLVHTGDRRYQYSQPQRMLSVLKKVTGLNAICAHFGGWSLWNDAWKVLAGNPNVWVDLSSSLYAIRDDKAVEIIHRYGADRVFFGSDYPMWKPVNEVERFRKLPLNQDEFEKISHENFENFLKIYS